jgi:hypothetical protein
VILRLKLVPGIEVLQIRLEIKHAFSELLFNLSLNHFFSCGQQYASGTFLDQAWSGDLPIE